MFAYKLSARSFLSSRVCLSNSSISFTPRTELSTKTSLSVSSRRIMPRTHPTKKTIKPPRPLLPLPLLEKQCAPITHETIGKIQAKMSEHNRSDAPSHPPLNWTPRSRRAGVIGRKIGMLSLWDHWGVHHAATVIKVDHCQVLDIDTINKPKKNRILLQMGAGIKKWSRCTKAMACHFLKAGVEPKEKVASFQITPDAALPPGAIVKATHFVPGQTLDIQGISKDKGFQGAMKRWGFHGMPASHGHSVSHRSLGATGQRQDPGKVHKGKKMAGHMGGNTNTVQNIVLYKIDTTRDLLYVLGSLPGNAGDWLIIRDSEKHKWDPATPPPFPTFTAQKPNELPKEIVMSPKGTDPFADGGTV
eukprot:TRINITY_DN1126_c0_g1_i1.p1 TRINITY_DN1126_c0_g1~~TRINITY_DN1126_c0_g1_i1.p1  ORF type:complete len:360 (+),score=69.45 TRINITY_DN1126_c0_g1_i1:126-1205(+)